MKIVGLTGGIGSGKSSVLNQFKNLGINTYSADNAAKKLINSDKDLIKSIKNLFGDNIYENNILDSVNLKINGGELTALVGHSGAGKTTIMNLIPRFYDCGSGDISVDDQSIYDVSLHSLRKNISLVSQETTLFDDTIKNNIAYANSSASQSDVEEACKFAAADDFIRKLPNKRRNCKGT